MGSRWVRSTAQCPWTWSLAGIRLLGEPCRAQPNLATKLNNSAAPVSTSRLKFNNPTSHDSRQKPLGASLPRDWRQVMFNLADFTKRAFNRSFVKHWCCIASLCVAAFLYQTYIVQHYKTFNLLYAACIWPQYRECINKEPASHAFTPLNYISGSIKKDFDTPDPHTLAHCPHKVTMWRRCGSRFMLTAGCGECSSWIGRITWRTNFGDCTCVMYRVPSSLCRVHRFMS